MIRPRVVAIVPAAGTGRRLGAGRKKPFVLLGGKPLVSYALRALDASNDIDGIIVACESSSIGRIRSIAKRYRIYKLIDVVAGGATRFESVRNCMSSLVGSFDVALIHDAARPFIDGAMIKRSVRAAWKFGACIAAVPESDTVKAANGALFIERTLDREKIFRAQTPQAFRYSLIRKAYLGRRSIGATDDASLVERDRPVKIVEGSYKNLKVTTKEDLKIAEAFLCG
ncbi:MAG: 2-C-methyl-D-erythritol 4-phosphate cytidylyltransferase [Candidatus Omnitrophica bacterium]|nr:2-C-methyl-D-erythritol 4-phosphate cytidylyltransferase [Candidatus Omnitrophota bacterium]MDD5436625.1 2-C-methyl-D-erythritol 4-phosphate cytidylyltransferase [Candidatus Omnitrophota bacterium]